MKTDEEAEEEINRKRPSFLSPFSSHIIVQISRLLLRQSLGCLVRLLLQRRRESRDVGDPDVNRMKSEAGDGTAEEREEESRSVGCNTIVRQVVTHQYG